MATQVRSHAKINLGLYLGAPRPDGFHGLVTVYQTLALHDLVTVWARPAAATAIRLTSNDERVPLDGGNTAWKMVALALKALEVCAEVDIHIEKRLPVQGGLGAGSANAVAALVGLVAERAQFAELAGLAGLAELASRRVSEAGGWQVGEEAGFGARWLEIAAQVGSDVPLFLIGGTVLGVDRGQRVSALPDLEPTWCVVASPSVGVSTPQAFRDWDALCAEDGLTPQASTDKLNELSRAYLSAFAEADRKSGSFPEGRQGAGSSGVPGLAGDLAGLQESALVRTGISRWIQNDFERVVFPQHPSLAEIKRILAGSGSPEAALHASLSGSGSALFGLYRTRGERRRPRPVCGMAGTAEVGSTVTRTLPRADYWREMLETEH